MDPRNDSLCTDCDAGTLTRRQVLARGLFGLGALAAAGILPRSAKAAATPSRPRAKAVIQLWMSGGPSHLDTFDPKPEAGYDYCGPFTHPIETNVKGIRISELMPYLAKQADKYSIIRSMTHGINAHETASYQVQTARPSGGRLVYPGVGAVISYFKGYDTGYKGLIPPYIVLTELQGRFSESGFLGVRYRPFATGGDPSKTPFVVEGIVAPGVSTKRQEMRRSLLRQLDTLGRELSSDPAAAAFRQAENDAYEMILGDGAKVFDLSRETAETRDLYGRTAFGQSCLVARRLVESGVPYITINLGGWDTHKDNFPAMRRLLPILDRGMAGLLQDLSRRGLLDTTIVWWSGEFGRTPKVMWEAPWNGGRGHCGGVFNAVLAGGGFAGGQVIGSSSATGEEVRERPVYPVDLIGSVYQRLGIDTSANLPNPMGESAHVMPLAAEAVKATGVLREIMPA